MLFLILAACTAKHGLYPLHKGDDAAFLTPTEGLEILKIDDTRLMIISDGVWALKFTKPKYSSVSIAPGHHVVVVNLEYFRDGGVFFLDANLVKGKLYLAKFNVIDRVEGKNEWVGEVWIEDASSGEKASKVIKNM